MNNDNLEHLRHSCAHLLAAAVVKLYPEALPTLGPAIDDGFYYDFDFNQKISDEDLPKIEEEMHKIALTWSEFKEIAITAGDAKTEFANNPYKLELIDDIEKDGQSITIQQSGDFRDLCRGGHTDNPADNLKFFKLLSLAGAYWRGSVKNKMLTRIYGTCWATEEELNNHLKHLDEVDKRDHRRLIKDLDLVSFHEEGGAGLAYWHPKGGRIRQAIEDFWRKSHREAGYEILYTPHIGVSSLWETSGHLGFYADSMYAPMSIDGQDYYIKPMNCPFHILIYKSKTRSYRDLPLRWAELGTVYRYERSGTLHGLLRVRGFTQDDAHIFCTPDQIEAELSGVLEFSVKTLKDFGFSKIKIELSVRDPKNIDKYAGDEGMWQKAEEALVKVISQHNFEYQRMEGEAVFYGPKIDIKIEDALGRTWQCSTIQFDFNLPNRFDIHYIASDGSEQKPYMVHRTLLGSLERFFGVLTEHYAGAFPVWLAPVQVQIIPVNDKVLDYCEIIAQSFAQENIRVEIDRKDGTLGSKIRETQMQKVPFMVIIGDREKENNTISVRSRTGVEENGIDLNQFKESVLKLINDRAFELTNKL